MRSGIPSLGASGAIAGMFAAFCMLYPNTKMQVLGFPDLQFSASTALLVPICMETILLIAFRTRLRIDFSAHLGGFLFGAGYAYVLREAAARRNSFTKN
jgi:membrane associated rhomboid family serine protease